MFGVVGAGLFAQPVQTLFMAPNQGTWMSQSITIIIVILAPPLSQFADLWGRKWIVILTLVCGGVGSFIASRAQNMATMIGAFCVIGVSYGCQPLLHAIASEILPRKQRPVAQGSINVAAGIATVVCILAAATLLRQGNYQNYRIYMYIAGGVFFVAATGVAIFYSPPKRELQTQLNTKEKLRSINWISYALFTPGLVLFCVALSWSKNPYLWTNSRIIVPFVLGSTLMASFAVYEWRFKKDGIFHHGLFIDRNMWIALITIFAEGLAFFAVNSYFAFSASVLTHADFFTACQPFVVVFVVSLVTALLAGLYSSVKRQLKLPITLGFTLKTIALICLAATSGGNPGAAFYAFAVLLGVGLGIVIPLVMVVAQLSTPAQLISSASALVIMVRAFGSTIGLAINNALFNSALSTEIPKRVAAAVIPLGLPAESLGMLIGALTTNDEALLAATPGITPAIIAAAGNAITLAYGIGFRNLWIASGCFTFVAAIGEFNPGERLWT